MTTAVLSVLTEHPQTIEELTARTGLPRRQVEAALERIRREGMAPICSESFPRRGVWLARSLDELEADIERGERRIRTMLATRRGQKRLLRRLREPLTLWREP
jgi:biotin operon repressor